MRAKRPIQGERQAAARANGAIQIAKNADIRAAKTIDALFRIADDKQSPDRTILGTSQRFDDFALARVRVLKLIHQKRVDLRLPT